MDTKLPIDLGVVLGWDTYLPRLTQENTFTKAKFKFSTVHKTRVQFYD